MSGVREDDRKTTYGLNTGPEADTRNTRARSFLMESLAKPGRSPTENVNLTLNQKCRE